MKFHLFFFYFIVVIIIFSFSAIGPELNKWISGSLKMGSYCEKQDEEQEEERT